MQLGQPYRSNSRKPEAFILPLLKSPVFPSSSTFLLHQLAFLRYLVKKLNLSFSRNILPSHSSKNPISLATPQPFNMASSTHPALQQRLLQDIAELQTKPYPNVTLHVEDEDITRPCLILTVDGYGPMHMTLEIWADYPLHAPKIKMDSGVHHPNIFQSYICASILNTSEDYTPAYTLKGIAIQLLSFFASEKLEQVSHGYEEARYTAISTYRDQQSYLVNTYSCKKCGYGKNQSTPISLGDYFKRKLNGLGRSNGESSGGGSSSPGKKSRRGKSKQQSALPSQDATAASSNDSTVVLATTGPGAMQASLLPDEILLMICEELDFEELAAFASSWSKIGLLVPQYGIIRTRELQCFCFKKNYRECGLGVGVAVTGSPTAKYGYIQSEFDLLSYEGFEEHHIRRSVSGIPFEHWLPLPISRAHWERKVKKQLTSSLEGIARDVRIGNEHLVNVIYFFMTDIVVKLNEASRELSTAAARKRAQSDYYQGTVKSSLTHASEKAIESYFHLFHLLLCMATADPSIVQAANRRLASFRSGKTSKTDAPNLGHLLVAVLISDVPMDDVLLKKIIRETVTRNVIWMFRDHPDLSYLEPSTISEYRLKETFTASIVSYRLLMFLNLFRRTAVGSPRTKPLTQLRDEAFERHGAPPRGGAKGLADSIKRIHQINNFPDFLDSMGLEKPGPAWFTKFLRDCVAESLEKGYHSMPISQTQAFALRLEMEPEVEEVKGLGDYSYPNMNGKSFFPRARAGDRGGRGDRGGYGGRNARGGRGGGNWRGPR